MIAHEFYLERDFAAQYPGCEREPGLNRNITNVNGSGIGPGHPVGSTGDRSITTLIYAMRKPGKTRGWPPFAAVGGVSMACAIGIM